MAIFKYNTRKKHCCLWNCILRTVKLYPQILASDWSNPSLFFLLLVFFKSVVCGWVMLKQNPIRPSFVSANVLLLKIFFLSRAFIYSDSYFLVGISLFLMEKCIISLPLLTFASFVGLWFVQCSFSSRRRILNPNSSIELSALLAEQIQYLVVRWAQFWEFLK